jgi:hypothetical protein
LNLPRKDCCIDKRSLAVSISAKHAASPGAPHQIISEQANHLQTMTTALGRDLNVTHHF